MGIRNTLKTIFISLVIRTPKIIVGSHPRFAINMHFAVRRGFRNYFGHLGSNILFLLAGTEKPIVFDVGHIVMLFL